jgi:hypothetical protein
MAPAAYCFTRRLGTPVLLINGNQQGKCNIGGGDAGGNISPHIYTALSKMRRPGGHYQGKIKKIPGDLPEGQRG